MELVIKFKTDNDAFQQDMKGEIERILGRIAMAIVFDRREGMVADHNGNIIGEWSHG